MVPGNIHTQSLLEDGHWKIGWGKEGRVERQRSEAKQEFPWGKGNETSILGQYGYFLEQHKIEYCQYIFIIDIFGYIIISVQKTSLFSPFNIYSVSRLGTVGLSVISASITKIKFIVNSSHSKGKEALRWSSLLHFFHVFRLILPLTRINKTWLPL